MFAVTAFSDAITTSITTSFAGGVFGRLAGHTFLLVGFVNTMLLIPLFLTANHRAQRWLGRSWKRLHSLVYVIRALLVLHLVLLAGFGSSTAPTGQGTASMARQSCTSVFIRFWRAALPVHAQAATRKTLAGTEAQGRPRNSCILDLAPGYLPVPSRVCLHRARGAL
jgi:DMSO/TMAO reductase YedYZ heme-binding membrane subunit